MDAGRVRLARRSNEYGNAKCERGSLEATLQLPPMHLPSNSTTIWGLVSCGMQSIPLLIDGNLASDVDGVRDASQNFSDDP